VAIYYEHTNQVVFPPAINNGCGNTDDDAFDQRETYSTRPAYSPSTNPVSERPSSHFWNPGDSNVDKKTLNESSVRRSYDPNGAFNNCAVVESYDATSENDSNITLNRAGDTVTVNLSTTATSDCIVLFGNDPADPWSCSWANTLSSFAADYDFKISAGTSLNLTINMSCTGPGLRYPDGTLATFGLEVGYYVIRLDTAGNRLPTNRDPSKRIISFPQECYDGSPMVDIQQLIELDAPENQGDIDRIIVVAYGQIGSYGNFGNDVGDPDATLGPVTNTTTMQGTIKLEPAN